MKSDKTKVLFILPALTTGGAEKVLITLMNNIDREIYEPVFLSVSNQGEVGALINSDIAQHSLNKKLKLFALPALCVRINAIEPDIVISTMAHMNFAVLLLRPFLNVDKFIVREAITPSFFLNKSWFKAKVAELGFRLLYSRADLVLSPSRLVFDEFESSMGLKFKNTNVLPNSIDENALRAGLENPFKELRPDTLKMVACGRLHYQKGFDRLLKILAEQQLSGDWRLDILGEGEERARLEVLIVELGLEGKVHLRGLTKNPERYFAYSDCVLMPSRYEGLPNVVLEALACGTQVIATKESGGIAEIGDAMETDDLKIVGSMEEFSQKMQELTPLAKEELQKSVLPKRFARPDVVKQFHENLKQVAKRG